MTDKILSNKFPLTLQQENARGSLIGDPFTIIVSVQRVGDEVTITIPQISLDFPPTELVNPNFPFPPDFPSGGFIDTIDNQLPKVFRHFLSMPVAFFIQSNGLNLYYVGEVDFRGRLRITGRQSLPIEVGRFVSLPASVSYVINKPKKICPHNFIVWSGFSNAAKYGADVSQRFDFGEYDDIAQGFHNNTLYSIWSDNSIELPLNDNPQSPYKNYAFAKIDTTSKCNPVISQVTNLSRVPGGITLPSSFTYAEGSMAVDSTGQNIAVVYQQRKTGSIGFILSYSNDGGLNWIRKGLGFGNDGLPVGGTDVHSRYDRFGGLWIEYITVGAAGTNIIYSFDQGNSFIFITTIFPGIACDFAWLGVGPDPENLDKDLLWCIFSPFDPAIANNRSSIVAKPIRINGLNSFDILPSNIFVLTDFRFGGDTVCDVGPSGEVAIGFVNLSYPDQSPTIEPNIRVESNIRTYLTVNKNGVNGTFTPFKDITEFTYGYFNTLFPPAQPHRSVAPATLLAFDKSNKYPGRIYIAYNDTLKTSPSTELKPFLIWSDNLGITWSSPYVVADNIKSIKNQINTGIAVDSVTGKVALTWYDGRNDINSDGQNVQRFATILDPRKLLPVITI